MIESWFLACIIALQLLALALMVFWLRGSTWRLVWLAIGLLLFTGTLRRSLLLIMMMQDRVALPPGVRQEIGVLAIFTVLLFAGTVIVNVMFRSLEQTERALRDSGTHFRGLVEHLPGVVYRAKAAPPWQTLYISSAVEQLTGCAPEKFLVPDCNYYHTFLHPEDRESALRTVAEKVGQKEPYDLRYRINNASGKISWVRDCGWAIFDDDGNPEHLTGFITDITESMQSDNLFRAQHTLAAKLSHAATADETLMHCLQTAIAISDMDAGGIYLVDEESGGVHLARHAGLPDWFVREASYYPPDSFNARLVREGRPLYTCYSTGEMPSDSVGMRESLKALAVVPVLYDDRVIACINVASHTLEEVPEFARASLETVAGQAGQVLLREKEQALRREREENLAALFISVRDMIFVLDEQCLILQVNPAVCQTLEYDEQDLEGRPIWEADLVQDAPEAQQQAEEIIAGKRDTCDLLIITRSGRRIPVETSIVTGTWNGAPAFFIIARDITERVRGEEMRLSLERQIQVARRLESLGILAGGVAHDFNNLLTVILGNAELVQHLLDESHPARKRLDLIMQTSRHASGLCRHMLTFAGRGPVAAETLYLNRLFLELEPLLKTMISTQATLHVHAPEDLPAMKGDPTQMRQVMMNLLMNASDAIGEQPGDITISVARQPCGKDQWQDFHLLPESDSDDYLVVSVADTGCGMDDDTSKKLFDPFFSTKFTGRGLGMAAVLGIVRAHNGGISVTSEPDRGSMFRLFFPVLEAADIPLVRENPASYSAGGNGDGGAILFVDDEAALHDVGRSAGAAEGYEVLTANNGIEAIEQYLLYGDTIKLVVLDLTMPVMNGVEAFQELGRINPEIRVLVASGYSTIDFEQKFSGKNLVGVLQKPYSSTSLREAIHKACG